MRPTKPSTHRRAAFESFTRHHGEKDTWAGARGREAGGKLPSKGHLRAGGLLLTLKTHENVWFQGEKGKKKTILTYFTIL